MHRLSHTSGVIYECSRRFNLAANEKLEEFANGARITFEILKSSQNYPILEEFELEKITICASPFPLLGLHIQNNGNVIYRSFFIQENAYIYCKYHYTSWNMFSSDDEITDVVNMFSPEGDDDDIPDFDD